MLFSRTKRDLETEIEACKDFNKLPGMYDKKRYDLRDLFLLNSYSGELDKVIRKNPRFVQGVAHTFNVLGAAGATYSVFREILTPIIIVIIIVIIITLFKCRMYLALLC